MINLTNNQVEAFNKLFELNRKGFVKIITSIYANRIMITIDSFKNDTRRYYTINKSNIECKSFRYIYNDNNGSLSKIRKKYVYKLKKR